MCTYIIRVHMYIYAYIYTHALSRSQFMSYIYIYITVHDTVAGHVPDAHVGARVRNRDFFPPTLQARSEACRLVFGAATHLWQVYVYVFIYMYTCSI